MGKYRMNRRLMLQIVCAVVVILLMPGRAEACCSCTKAVSETSSKEWFQGDDATVTKIIKHIVSEFTAHRQWFVEILWEDNILPAMMLMGEQLSAVAMQQTQIIGSFFDAKHQLETQQLLQRLNARAHKDYQPSIGMCEFGTTVRSLAASERNMELNQFLISQRFQDRNLGNAYSSSATGEDLDTESRLRQFREKFCDPKDNNDGLSYMCQEDPEDKEITSGELIGGQEPERLNKDIDYARTFDWPWTMDVDFTDTEVTDNEEELLALSSNLYGADLFLRPPKSTLEPRPSAYITDMQKIYMDMRSVIAKRSVAENSFAAIMAMKSAGTPGSREYLIGMLQELGISQGEAENLIGVKDKDIAPSYYAQMEVLTKKVYQNPDFYTHLYDTPANVERKGVAIQAIGLMQKFDLFKSYLRNEASLSVLLELAVMDLQEEVENTIGTQKAGGTAAVE